MNLCSNRVVKSVRPLAVAALIITVSLLTFSCSRTLVTYDASNGVLG